MRDEQRALAVAGHARGLIVEGGGIDTSVRQEAGIADDNRLAGDRARAPCPLTAVKA